MVVVVIDGGQCIEGLGGKTYVRAGRVGVFTEWRVGIVLLERSVVTGLLHDVLVCVVEEEGGGIAIGSCEDDIQSCIEWLPGVEQGEDAVVQRIQLLDALEAIVDEKGPGSQDVARVHALLDSSSHVVVLEGQAVAAPVCLDHEKEAFRS